MLEEQQTGKEAQDKLVRPATDLLAETGVVYRGVQDQSIFKYVMHLQNEQVFFYKLNLASQDLGPGKVIYTHWEKQGTLHNFPSKHHYIFCCVATWVVEAAFHQLGKEQSGYKQVAVHVEEDRRITMTLEKLQCAKAEHQCQSNEVNRGAWDGYGALTGSEASPAFLDVRIFLITFLTASDAEQFVC